MRLSHKLTQYFTLIVFVSLAFGFFVFYFAIERAGIQSIIGKLDHLNTVVEHKLEKESILQLSKQYPYTQIRVLANPNVDLAKKVVKEGQYAWSSEIQAMVRQVSVTTQVSVNSKHYEIQSHLPQPMIDDEFLWGIVMVVAWIFVFIIITIIFFGELITRKLYTPFIHLLDQMKAFDVRNNQKLEPLPTHILEFAQLNNLFLKTSTESANHYNALKEFTQNLSHELQTPMANMKGKIELLFNTNLSEEQMRALSSMYDELDRVSSINQSLVLLMSLNHHKVTNESVNFSEILNSALRDFEDLIAMKNLTVEAAIPSEIFIQLNSLLANLVVNNLFSNAIKHNVEKGRIVITLTDKTFTIKNTGHEQEFNNESIFNRFTKGKYNAQSIGIGLALVKKVVTVYGYKIEYSYDNYWHKFDIKFI